MTLDQLDDALEGYSDIPPVTYEEIIEHYDEMGYGQIDYRGRQVYLFSEERDFRDNHHIVMVNGPNAPRSPEHIYQFVMIKYPYRGTWVSHLDGVEVPTHEGECLLLDRYVPQWVEETGPGDCDVTIVLSEEFFRTHLLDRPAQGKSAFERELGDPASRHDGYRLFPTADDMTVHTLVRLMLCEKLDPGPASSRMTDALAEALLTRLFDAYERPSANVEIGERSQLAGEIREYAAQNYRGGSLNDLADKLGYQRTYLCRIIKQSTGQTFKQLVNTERMKRAVILLQANDMPVYEVAHEVGFSNITTFYERFREWTGCTPKEWRERTR